VAFDGEGLRAIGLEAGGNVVVVEARGVEPVFKGGAPPAVTEHAAVPDTLEPRDLVIAVPLLVLRVRSGLVPTEIGRISYFAR
jgi:hypothetical protein